jgi:SSS family solute:Na+ symporter
MFATIISTLNSFLFLSATTIGRDFIFRIKKESKEENIKSFTVIGIAVTGVLSILIAIMIPSVVEIWYTIGSIFIPGIILPVISAYYPALRISPRLIITEIVFALSFGMLWFDFRNSLSGILSEIEPMIIGLFGAIIIHIYGLLRKSFFLDK